MNAIWGYILTIMISCIPIPLSSLHPSLKSFRPMDLIGWTLDDTPTVQESACQCLMALSKADDLVDIPRSCAQNCNVFKRLKTHFEFCANSGVLIFCMFCLLYQLLQDDFHQ